MREERLDLRGKRHARAVAVDEQRLLAGTIARQREGAVTRVPDAEREHAVERVDGLVAALFEEVHDDFGVGVRAEDVALVDERLPQLAVVVDLAVEDELDRSVLVADRLIGGRYADR